MNVKRKARVWQKRSKLWRIERVWQKCCKDVENGKCGRSVDNCKRVENCGEWQNVAKVLGNGTRWQKNVQNGQSVAIVWRMTKLWQEFGELPKSSKSV